MIKKCIFKILVILISLFVIFLGTYKFDKNKDINYEEINYNNVEEISNNVEEKSNDVIIPNKRDDFLAEKQKNKDVKAWITIPGTTIDWPVMQWIVVNPEQKCFYDRRDENKNYSFAGSIYSGEGVKFEPYNEISNNLILHGHNLDDNPNGKRFAQLMKFLDIEFAKNTPYIFLTTEDADLVYQIYAVYFTDIDFNCYWIGLGENDMLGMINGAKERSEYVYDVDATGKDKIITLSTCTYKYGKNGSNGQKYTRFVIQGKLLTSNSKLSSTVSIKKNPNPKQPVIPKM